MITTKFDSDLSDPCLEFRRDAVNVRGISSAPLILPKVEIAKWFSFRFSSNHHRRLLGLKQQDNLSGGRACRLLCSLLLLWVF